MNTSYQEIYTGADNYTELYGLSKTQVIILSTLNIFFSITGTSANLFICCLIVSTESLYKARYFLIFSLCLSDILVSMLSQPMYASSLITHQNETFETIRKTLSWVSMLASVGNILAVTVDRFIAIASPFKYPSRMNNRSAIFMIIPVWLISLVLGLTSTLEHTSNAARTTGQYYALVLLLVFIIPMYGRIYLIAHKQAQTIRNSLPERRKFNKDNVALRTVGMIILTFCVCWFPLIVVPFLNRYKVLSSEDIILSFSLVNTLALSSATINPLIFCGRTKEFKTVIRRSLYKLCMGGKVQYNRGKSIRLQSRFSKSTKVLSSPVSDKRTGLTILQTQNSHDIPMQRTSIATAEF